MSPVPLFNQDLGRSEWIVARGEGRWYLKDLQAHVDQMCARSAEFAAFCMVFECFTQIASLVIKRCKLTMSHLP
jgi:hypothetical protein